MKMFDLKGTVLGLNKPGIISLLNSIELYLTYGVDRDAAYEAAIGNLSAASVKALAQEILSQENFIELVMKPAATAEAE